MSDDNQDQDHQQSSIEQLRRGSIANKPSQPHVAGPTEGFYSDPAGDAANGKQAGVTLSRSSLQTSGLQPREEFLKEQDTRAEAVRSVEDRSGRKRPLVVMTLAVGVALLISIAGIVVAFQLMP